MANLALAERDGFLKHSPDYGLAAAWRGQGAQVAVVTGQVLARWDQLVQGDWAQGGVGTWKWSRQDN